MSNSDDPTAITPEGRQPPADARAAISALSGPGDRMLDVRGLACPLPVLKARKALLGMRPGERLAVVATDPLAAVDIPHFCKEAGHRLLSQRKRDHQLVFLIERG